MKFEVKLQLICIVLIIIFGLFWGGKWIIAVKNVKNTEDLASILVPIPTKVVVPYETAKPGEIVWSMDKRLGRGALSPDWKLLAISYGDTMGILDVENREWIHSFPIEFSEDLTPVFSSDGKTLSFVEYNFQKEEYVLRALEVGTWRELSRKKISEDENTIFVSRNRIEIDNESDSEVNVYSRDKKFRATLTRNEKTGFYEIKVMEIATQKEHLHFHTEQGDIYFDFSPDGKRFYAGNAYVAFMSGDPLIMQFCMWDLESEKPAFVLQNGCAWNMSATFLPDGKRLALYGDQNISLRDIKNGQSVRELPKENFWNTERWECEQLVFSPSGQQFLRHRGESLEIGDAKNWKT